jgi:hypothetical protein
MICYAKPNTGDFEQPEQLPRRGWWSKVVSTLLGVQMKGEHAEQLPQEERLVE